MLFPFSIELSLLKTLLDGGSEKHVALVFNLDEYWILFVSFASHYKNPKFLD
jgi:hypothetical protein